MSVTDLPVRFKKPVDEETPTFQLVNIAECRHEATYLLDDALTQVECSVCHAKLSPMWVLKKLCSAEHRYWRNRQAYKEEMARLERRSSTKCQHCKKQTRISRS